MNGNKKQNNSEDHDVKSRSKTYQMTESRTVHDDLTRKMFRKFKKLTCKILERSCHVPACRLDARGWPQGGGSLDRGHAFVHQHGRHHRPHRVGRESGRQTC
jgi:hypothetical protein